MLKKEILGAGVLPGSDYFSLRIITYIIKNYEALIFSTEPGYTLKRGTMGLAKYDRFNGVSLYAGSFRFICYC